MFNKRIEYCVERITKLLNESKLKCDEFNDYIEELMLFDSNIPSYELTSKCHGKNMIYTSKIYYQQIILQEIKKINTFKKLSGQSEMYLSEYGSLYCGNGILYYNDILMTYNNEQFLQIILNHIGHYLHECISNNRNDIIIKSNNLLMLYHVGLINYKIAYSNKHRSTLYTKPEYSKIVDDLILFTPNKLYREFIVNNVIETNFYRVYKDHISGVNLRITESNVNCSTYNIVIMKSIKASNRKYSNNEDAESIFLMKKIQDDSDLVKESLNIKMLGIYV